MTNTISACDYNITVVGSGYVGMSLAVLLAQDNKVTVLDIDHIRVDKINNKISTIADKDIEKFLAEKSLNLSAMTDKKSAYIEADFIIIATPTNYDTETNKFDTSSVDLVVGEALSLNKDALIVIKSTLPIGHTNFLNNKHKTSNVIFSPEFLREGQALSDNLNPSRIIIGSEKEEAKKFCDLLEGAAEKKEIETLFMPSTEAESVKLFANSYLAMRVAFFNELDSFALSNGLDASSIIEGISLDKRIGNGYNNPSFGYGGYCLPKDTKQLLSNYKNIPQTLISSIVSSNFERKNFIASEIIKRKPKVVGFHRLAMKEGSDNFRSSAIQGIMKRVTASGIKTILYEPNYPDAVFYESQVVADLDQFISQSDLIISNRASNDLKNVENKIFTRDIFKEN
jgi:UDPglucose 6-dehydrogenase